MSGAGAVFRDHALTRHWSGRVGQLLTPRPAYLARDNDSAVFVDDAPAGSRIRIHDMYRVGPLNADIRALANPEAAPELWLIVPWYALTSR